MKRAMKMAEFARMTRPEQDRVLREMVAASRQPPNGEVREMDAEVAAFERRFGFDSATMQRKVRSGELAETLEVCQWLMALRRRERLVERASRAR